MKTLKTIIIAICFTIGIQKIHSQNYKLDKKNSTLFWTGKAAFSSYSLKGSITLQQGTISITKSTISSLHLIIDMKSIDHENNDLKNHLKNEDFFEVETYPEAAFSTKNATQINNTNAILNGVLTIKGKTNSENIPVTLEQTESGLILKFNYTINRTKYSVNHNSPSIFKRMKENAIADEFILQGTIVFTQ
ncbi:YceI family protein [Aquimarina sp. 2201CG14-23]|uniref:YceI family protein n=1 Tax=Aquimarina mycalae TaxID=3040073 RepID=UPI0024781BDF|nr:YceI family protein [Aquimarina sp. 2201CG14-23]MDH7447957.1 YceI family protein [Aquimarina sp. 2201CG14-23]